MKCTQVGRVISHQPVTGVSNQTLHNAEIRCSVGVDNDSSKAVVSFNNLDYGVITAVKFKATGFNAFGEIVHVPGNNPFFLIVQNISVAKNSPSQENHVNLPSSEFHHLELEECQVCYDDGTISIHDVAEYKEIEFQEYNDFGPERAVLQEIKSCVSPQAKCIPKSADDGWLCCCERFNRIDSKWCTNCGVSRTDVFKIADPSFIAELLGKRKKEEEERRDLREQSIQKNMKRRAIRRRIFAIGVLVAIVLSILIGRAVILSGRSTFSSEDAMKTALQGTYTYSYKGEPLRQIVIEGDTYKVISIGRWSDSRIEPRAYEIRRWNYKNGTLLTFGRDFLVVTKDGDLKDLSNIYKKEKSSPEGNQ